MKFLRNSLPMLTTLLLAGAMLWHGPIAQSLDYHAFADRSVHLGLPHFADVTSNLGFALVAIWGWLALVPVRQNELLKPGWLGYRLFLIGLLLTALGSAYYHLAPDNARLVWDRLPIALSCAGLLAGVRGDVRQQREAAYPIVLGIFAILSVVWWNFTEQVGSGDLRPYLFLQALPLLLIPLWQWQYRAPRADRLAFGSAIAFYALAKWAELNDHAIAATLGGVTGHTLKHGLATVAVAMVVARLIGRVRSSGGVPAGCSVREAVVAANF